MKVHVAFHPDRPIAETADLVVEAEQLSYAGAWIADSQNLFRDVYAALAVAAMRTHTIRLGTGVTNPVTRHPAVIASAISSVDELSAGRVTLGIGTGETAVQSLGKKRARLAQLEQTAITVRALLQRETTTFEDAAISMPWPRRAVPIHIASTGPRSLALAGRVADGVYLKIGAHPELVRWAIGACYTSAVEAGRDMSSFEVHTLLPCAVSDDGTSAREQVKGFAAAIAGAALAAVPREAVPERLWQDMQRLNESSAAARAQQSYVEWLESPAYRELITDTIVDAFSVAGTPSEVIGRLEELAALGVSGTVVPLITGEPRAQLQAIGRGVAARFAAAD